MRVLAAAGIGSAMPQRMMVLAVLLVSLTGCGGGGEKQPSAREQPRTDATQRPPSTTEQVVETFRGLADVRLEADTGSEDILGYRTLALGERDVGKADDPSWRFGNFNVLVITKPEGRDFFKEGRRGRKIRPDRNGIYWERLGESFTGQKPYGDAVLTIFTERRAPNLRFRRLDLIMRQIGKPLEQAAEFLPDAERPCESLGVTAAGGPETSCRERQLLATYVNAGSSLRLRPATIRVASAGPSREYLAGGRRFKPNGVYVEVAVVLRNEDERALLSVPDASLRVGDRDYAVDDEAALRINAITKFPIRPGRKAALKLPFDVPADIGERATREGAITFAVGETGDVIPLESAVELGRIRLADASG